MLCKAKVAVCSDIRAKHSTLSEHHVEFLNVKPGGMYKPLDFKRLTYDFCRISTRCARNLTSTGA